MQSTRTVRKPVGLPTRRRAALARGRRLAERGALAMLAVVGLWVGGCGEGADESERRDRGGVRAVAEPVDPAPKPDEPIAAGASCVTARCHADLMAVARPHGPVAARQCSACHGPEQPVHRFPLKQPVNATCAACHVPMKGAHRHAPIDETGCIACHDPHGTDTGYLLVRDTREQLCSMCHQVDHKAHEHGPFARGACTVCHDPHVAPGPKLLRGGTGNDHCFTCHEDMGRLMHSAAVVHEPATGSCLACHDAHSSDHRFQLASEVEAHCAACHGEMVAEARAMPVQHRVGEGASCGACHNPHAAANAQLLNRRQAELCVQCHSAPIEQIGGGRVRSMAGLLERKFLHGPIRSGECSGCHPPHGALEASLLTRRSPETFYAPFVPSRYELCFSCHAEAMVLRPKTETLTNFRDGDRNLHYVHVNREQRGRTCKTCHDVHGSDLPNHIARSVPFAGSDWAMPINYEPIDEGGRCTPGCHEAATYQRTSAQAG